LTLRYDFRSVPASTAHPPTVPCFYPGNAACSSSANETVPIPVGDGYISGLKVAVAKAGPPYVGELVFYVTPKGGGVPTSHACGYGGGIPATMLSPLELLAVYDLQMGCAAAPAATGRRRLAASATVVDATSLHLSVGVPSAPGAAVPTLRLNGDDGTDWHGASDCRGYVFRPWQRQPRASGGCRARADGDAELGQLGPKRARPDRHRHGL